MIWADLSSRMGPAHCRSYVFNNHLSFKFLILIFFGKSSKWIKWISQNSTDPTLLFWSLIKDWDWGQPTTDPTSSTIPCHLSFNWSSGPEEDLHCFSAQGEAYFNFWDKNENFFVSVPCFETRAKSSFIQSRALRRESITRQFSWEFLATLVALHFTPVSLSVGRSFELAQLRGLRACLPDFNLSNLSSTLLAGKA